MNGKQFAFAQAAFRFKPDGSDFEVMTGSTNNTWGLGFSETFDVFGSTANNDPSFYMAIAEPLLRRHRRTADAGTARQWARAIRASRRSTPSHSADAVHPPGRRLQRLHRRRRPSSLHGALVPEGVLEPHRVHQRADGAPRRPGDHREAGRRLRHARRLESRRRRRGVVRAGARAGRPGRRGVGRRLVQLHHPAQPDAAGLQQRRRQRLRDVDARPSPRPHLPRRLQERAGGAEAVALEDGHRRPARGARVRQHAVAAARRSGCSSSAGRRTSCRSCWRS